MAQLVARLTPDQKVGSSSLSVLIFFIFIIIKLILILHKQLSILSSTRESRRPDHRGLFRLAAVLHRVQPGLFLAKRNVLFCSCFTESPWAMWAFYKVIVNGRSGVAWKSLRFSELLSGFGINTLLLLVLLLKLSDISSKCLALLLPFRLFLQGLIFRKLFIWR